MTRLLGLVALAVVVWIFLEFAWVRVRRALAPSPPPPKKMPPPERLVRCEGCDSHVPATRTSTGADGRVLCERCTDPLQ